MMLLCRAERAESGPRSGVHRGSSRSMPRALTAQAGGSCKKRRYARASSLPACDWLTERARVPAHALGFDAVLRQRGRTHRAWARSTRFQPRVHTFALARKCLRIGRGSGVVGQRRGARRTRFGHAEKRVAREKNTDRASIASRLSAPPRACRSNDSPGAQARAMLVARSSSCVSESSDNTIGTASIGAPDGRGYRRLHMSMTTYMGARCLRLS